MKCKSFRDLKHANIFIAEPFIVKVGDFGLVQKLRSDGTFSLRNRCGTVGFMAPEVAVIPI